MDYAKPIIDELTKLIGQQQFDSFTPGVRAAALQAATILGQSAAGIPVSAADLLMSKSILLDVQVIGMAEAGNLWTALGQAAGNLVKPFLSMLGSLFGVKL